MLELPSTLRLASRSDYKPGPELEEQLKQTAGGNLVPGYKLWDKPEEQQYPFNFYAEVNVNNGDLWQLVLALTKALPEVCALIIHHIDEDPFFGKYTDKLVLLATLSSLETELTEDTFLAWGLIYQD